MIALPVLCEECHQPLSAHACPGEDAVKIIAGKDQEIRDLVLLLLTATRRLSRDPNPGDTDFMARAKDYLARKGHTGAKAMLRAAPPTDKDP